jgi:hypothetical protein
VFLPQSILFPNTGNVLRERGLARVGFAVIFLHDFPEEMARIQFPLVLKSFVRVQPPLQWKGGMLCELCKMKGSPSSCGNYRDVMLADDAGKAVGKLIRQRLLPHAVALSVNTQF